MNDYFEEMNIDYSELNDYEDIETYYDKIKDYSNLVNELQCDRVESQKYIVRANKKIKQLQSNWNSLRELIEDKKTRLAKECSHTYEDSLGKTKYVNEDIFNELDKILDKMNELEGKDKE